MKGLSSLLARRILTSSVSRRLFSSEVTTQRDHSSLGGLRVNQLLGLMDDRIHWRYLVDSKKPSVGVVSVPFSGGQPKSGVEHGPSALLNNGLLSQLNSLGWKTWLDEPLDSITPEYAPTSDVASDQMGILKRPRYVGRVSERVHARVKQLAEQKHLALTLGGDHSIAMGTISGTAAVHGNDLAVIWIDAHADINTPETTVSGNLHGCPLSFILGLANPSQVPGLSWLSNVAPFPSISPDRIVYIGLRDVDAPEKQLIRQHHIRAFSMHDVDRHGIGKVMDMALQHVDPHGTRRLHLSFDVDALDPSVAPSTGTPVRGGLTFREGHFICEMIAATGRLVAMDLVEVNPCEGDARQQAATVEVGCSLVRAALGETLL